MTAADAAGIWLTSARRAYGRPSWVDAAPLLEEVRPAFCLATVSQFPKPLRPHTPEVRPDSPPGDYPLDVPEIQSFQGTQQRVRRR